MKGDLKMRGTLCHTEFYLTLVEVGYDNWSDHRQILDAPLTSLQYEYVANK